MLLAFKWQVEIITKFGPYLQDLRLILTKRLLYLIGFAANTGNSSRSHTCIKEYSNIRYKKWSYVNLHIDYQKNFVSLIFTYILLLFILSYAIYNY